VNNVTETNKKKEWTTPDLVVYGDVEKITQQTTCPPGDPTCKVKRLGASDDFATNITTVIT
jgi:hypothetical protein